mmetsp:Transcript_61037/g.181863  ORF Transcript_61037/g.181863 Transcript_61037/m.181863 type:complete len:202 (+) Transcript_61037:519-1124(+)
MTGAPQGAQAEGGREGAPLADDQGRQACQVVRPCKGVQSANGQADDPGNQRRLACNGTTRSLHADLEATSDIQQRKQAGKGCQSPEGHLGGRPQKGRQCAPLDHRPAGEQGHRRPSPLRWMAGLLQAEPRRLGTARPSRGHEGAGGASAPRICQRPGRHGERQATGGCGAGASGRALRAGQPYDRGEAEHEGPGCAQWPAA